LEPFTGEGTGGMTGAAARPGVGRGTCMPPPSRSPPGGRPPGRPPAGASSGQNKWVPRGCDPLAPRKMVAKKTEKLGEGCLIVLFVREIAETLNQPVLLDFAGGVREEGGSLRLSTPARITPTSGRGALRPSAPPSDPTFHSGHRPPVRRWPSARGRSRGPSAPPASGAPPPPGRRSGPPNLT